MQYSFSKFFSMLCSLLVVSSKEEREREKKKSGTALWLTIWGCGSPALCCHPAVAADLRNELNTRLPPQAFLLRKAWKSFPFPSTRGEVTLHLLSQVSVFIYSSHEKWAFPPLLWSLPPTTVPRSFHAPGCQACAASPAFSSQLVYLQFHEGLPLPPHQQSGRLAFFATCLFCCCLLFSFSFFPWVGVGLSRGLCWSGPGLSVGVLHAA
jgi:hypothetical protein